MNIIPIICKDIKNLRSYYLLSSENGWQLEKTNKKLELLITIIDNQIYHHCKKNIKYSSKRGKTSIINIFLRKSDYAKIEDKLDKVSKTIQKPVLDTK